MMYKMNILYEVPDFNDLSLGANFQQGAPDSIHVTKIVKTMEKPRLLVGSQYLWKSTKCLTSRIQI